MKKRDIVIIATVSGIAVITVSKLCVTEKLF